MSPHLEPDDAKAILPAAFPPPPPVDMSNYVTRMELSSVVANIESKIEVAELKQRNWVLGGCVAILIAFGGGWITLFSKVDALATQSTETLDRLEKRAAWMERADETNRRQDASLRRVDQTYEPLPYKEPPTE